jgi:F420-non-reducing hydrogenase iron-sulfur subunit
MKEGFEPRILGFLCNWCGYAGADMAGTSRIQYPPNVRIIRVMCSGRIDPSMILTGLSMGMDGVLVVGCHHGDCHYIKGNYRTERRVHLLKKMLGDMGYDPSRLRLEWVSASEGEKFGQVVRDFSEKLKNIGPNPTAREMP